jgi:hypothetical protein
MNIKIAIGIPTTGQINSETTKSLMKLMTLPYEFVLIFQHGAYVSQNREKIVARAKGCDYLLFIDHDMKFKPSDIEVLIKHNKDFVAALYNEKELPLHGMFEMLSTEDYDDYNIPKELFKVEGIGLGCSLIKMSLFDKLDTPYFPMKYDKKGIVMESEDIGFCRKVREAGLDVWCEPTLNIKHLGGYEY